MDTCVPVEIRTSRLKQNRHKIPWCKEVSQAKATRRKLERRLKNSGLTIDRELLKHQIVIVRFLVKKSQGQNHKYS